MRLPAFALGILIAVSQAAHAVPSAPKVTAPTGTYVGGKPMVVFTGPLRAAFRVKIARDAAGASAVWESRSIASPGSSAPCQAALADGPYYAFAQIADSDGWSQWSKGCAFTVDRKQEGLDIRHMDEPELLTKVADAPNDMFGYKLDELCLERECKAYTVQSSYLGATNTIWRIEDNGHGFPTAILRRHAVRSIDLDKGVTVVSAVRCQAQQNFGTNPEEYVPIWMRGQIVIADAGGIEPCGAAFRVMRDSNIEGKWLAYNGYDNVVGICADNRTWQEANLGTKSDDFLVVRITGKNQTAGDYTSTKWQLYVNESTTPAVTQTGSIPRSIMDPKSNWMTTDCVLVGQGFASLEVNLDFDWLAVNTGGDYAPGEWDSAVNAYVPGGGTRSWNGPYTSIAELRNANETAFARLATHPMVISRVAKDLKGAQTCMYIQDDTGGIKIASPNAYPRSVGREVTSLAGVVPWLLDLNRVSENVISVVNHPNPQPEMIPNEITMPQNKPGVKPLETNLQALMGDGPARSIAEVSPKDLGKLVSIRGKLSHVEIDPATAYWVYYVDDGSCPTAIDGRGVGLPGMRIARRRDSSDSGSDVRPWGGEFMWTVEGILTYEPNGLGSYVRTLAVPSFVMK